MTQKDNPRTTDPNQKNNLSENTLFILFGLPLFMAPVTTAGESISGALFILFYITSGYWRKISTVLTRPWFWPLIALLSINFLGMLWTEDLQRGVVVLSKLNYFMFTFAGATLPWNRKYFRWVVILFLSGLGINESIVVLQYLNLFPWGNNYTGIGPTGFANHIFLSLLLANALLWLIYDFKNQVVLTKRVSLALGIVFFILLFMAGGRTGQLVFLLLFPVSVLILYPERWRVFVIGFVLLILIGVSFSPFIQKRYSRGVQDLKEYQAGTVLTGSVAIRIIFLEGAIKMLKSHPLLGVGTGDYKLEMARLQKQGELPETPGIEILDNPHNSYAAYFSGLGLAGISILVWFLSAIVRECWPYRASPEAWFKLCYYGIFIVGSFGDTLIWGHDHAFALALITAIPPHIGFTEKPVSLKINRI